MFDKLKDKLASGTRVAADSVQTAKEAMQESVSMETNINRTLNAMEAIAREASRRDSIKDFTVSAKLSMVVGEICLEVRFDPNALE